MPGHVEPGELAGGSDSIIAKYVSTSWRPLLAGRVPARLTGRFELTLPRLKPGGSGLRQLLVARVRGATPIGRRYLTVSACILL